MIQTSNEYAEQETLRKYVAVIRHFRGYLDKERYADDLDFLRAFVGEVGCSCGGLQPVQSMPGIPTAAGTPLTTESSSVGPYSV